MSTSARLKDQVAIVTGGGQGIGREICFRLAAEGAAVLVADVNDAGAKETARMIADRGGPAARAVALDLRDEESVKRMAAEAGAIAGGRIDLLVNDAGIAGPIALVEDIALADWANCLAVNLTGMFLTCKHVVPAMKKRKRGSIVNIASVVGKRPIEQRTAYGSSKMAVIGFTRCLAQEVGAFGIRANSICPSGVTGPRMDMILEGFMKQSPGKSREEVIAERQKAIALRSYVDPADVAASVAFLASDDAKMITGQDVNVCAGTIMY